MAGFNVNLLFSNDLGAKATLCGPTGGNQMIIRSVVIVNTGGSPVLVNLYVKKSGGTSKHVIASDTSIAAGASLYADAVMTLGSGDELEGDASAGGAECSVFGVEITP